MAKQIIVLDTNVNDGGEVTLNVVMWFPVIPGKENPQPSVNKSAWTGASASEITAIQLGSVLEEVKTLSYPANFSQANIKSALVAAYSSRASYLATLPFRGQYYGLYFDGSTSTWSA